MQTHVQGPWLKFKNLSVSERKTSKLTKYVFHSLIVTGMIMQKGVGNLKSHLT